jgi:hypothetical protein
MRLWSINPSKLDPKGIVALWREGLLAHKVLRGETVGYRNHPQLDRFRGNLNLLSEYLHVVCDDADRRGYNFDRSKLPEQRGVWLGTFVTTGQIRYELEHLASKVMVRTGKVLNATMNDVHPVFTAVIGPIEPWERIGGDK